MLREIPALRCFRQRFGRIQPVEFAHWAMAS
jgi:hypothetical protein